MTIDRKFVIDEIKSVVVLILLGIFMAWSGFGCRGCEFNTPLFWKMATLNAVMWVALWKGNSYLADLMSWKWPWIKYPMSRFVFGLIATIVYSLGIMYLILAIYSWQLQVKINYSTGYSILITISISLFMHGREFLINWRKAAVDAERLQKENIAAQYQSLKSQINPHFLFNTLNVLTNVVYEDQDKAAKFIKKLSEVYRYVLDTRDREVVPLEEELKFLSSYIYLQKIRFADKLQLDIQLDEVKG
ncbi:MAG TPA: histidine kinase, partial [Ohtaekwangia sp.]|uniref:sensor histidine kinase n=1 Tax=Ohtaekwangia sp. TaxID=2066019 RepID=UPI002F92C791